MSTSSSSRRPLRGSQPAPGRTPQQTANDGVARPGSPDPSRARRRGERAHQAPDPHTGGRVARPASTYALRARRNAQASSHRIADADAHPQGHMGVLESDTAAVDRRSRLARYANPRNIPAAIRMSDMFDARVSSAGEWLSERGLSAPEGRGLMDGFHGVHGGHAKRIRVRWRSGIINRGCKASARLGSATRSCAREGARDTSDSGLGPAGWIPERGLRTA
jgi:hypothetical protein